MIAAADVLIPASDAALPVRPARGVDGLGGMAAAWAAANDFGGKPSQVLIVPGTDGKPDHALMGVGEKGLDPMAGRCLAAKLPAADWRLEGWSDEEAHALTLAFLLGAYQFDRYKAKSGPRPRLVAPAALDLDATRAIADACFRVRRMVDTPAADMGPAEIEAEAREVAKVHGASVEVTTGDALLKANYPAVHAVGRAAAPHRAPRLIEIGWNLDAADRPLVALVGKGVAFDSGGLDIKPAAGMRNMKKDMGGAAHVLGLAQLIMGADLPVRLVVLVAAVENAISADAFRPGDVLQTRKGLTVEVGNTDAEGRLILSDALARAGEHRPDLTLDFATLTGAARVALGPELPPLYTDDETLAADLLAASARVGDPLWRMPLWPGYRTSVEAEIADLRNDSAAWAQAGSVTAALFLQRFAPDTGAWAHLDVFAWNPRARPGWPEGGEAQGIRAAFDMMRCRFPQG
ncbi:leucyl aminopeptidase family protein [Brevundimonas sp.]|jgi:leucyl aminopeptidase|uniref:leucyl aminopeptidase family protein n=1 Tax=Brevundimonas sp. TaxID=1871086 RepID=UPI002E0F686C|nr:leucyl aminopeptidase family protein [Brevundimonas sp.]